MEFLVKTTLARNSKINIHQSENQNKLIVPNSH